MELSDLTTWTAIWLPTLTLVIVRVAGMFLVAPVLSEQAVPVKLRALMSVAISLAVVGRLPQPAALPGDFFGLVSALGGELLLGATIGYAARLLFSGIQMAAFQISQQMGISLAEVYDPLGEESSGVLRQFFHLLVVVLFLSIGGHRLLIGALLGSFRSIPPLGFSLGQGVLAMVASLLSVSFVLALKVAAPVLIAMLLATVALGLLQRSVPQCNILSTGLPARALLGLLMLAAGLAALPGRVQAATRITFSAISALPGPW